MDSVLIIDDDIELSAMLRDYLSSYEMNVQTEHDGLTGLQRAESGEHDIVVLDIMLPSLDGFDILRRLRVTSEIGIVLLTARDHEDDRICGFELGADDYLPKPFNPRELLARMRVILRHSRAHSSQDRSRAERIEAGGVTIDLTAHTTFFSGKQLHLTTAEFLLLETFMHAIGKVLTREELFESVFHKQFHPFDRSLDMHVSRLRRKLIAAGAEQIQICTVRSEGYLFASLDTDFFSGAIY